MWGLVILNNNWSSSLDLTAHSHWQQPWQPHKPIIPLGSLPASACTHAGMGAHAHVLHFSHLFLSWCESHGIHGSILMIWLTVLGSKWFPNHLPLELKNPGNILEYPQIQCAKVRLPDGPQNGTLHTLQHPAMRSHLRFRTQVPYCLVQKHKNMKSPGPTVSGSVAWTEASSPVL